MRMIKKSYCKKDGWQGELLICSVCEKPTIMKDIPDRRNGWYYLNHLDKPLIAVNKAFSGINKFGLNKWREKKCAEYALFNPELDFEQIQNLLYEDLKKSQEIGTATHDYIQKLEESPDITDPTDDIAPYIRAYKAFKETFPMEVEFSEAIVANPELDYAGRIDVIVNSNGTRWLLDWKTSNYISEESGYQLSAYKNATELITTYKGKQNVEPMPKVDKTAIVQLKDNGTFTFAEKDEPHKIYLNHLENYKHSSLKEYYENL